MAGINTAAIVSYNGYVFPKAHNLKILSDPIQAKSGLSVKYHRTRIQVQFLIHLHLTAQLNTSDPLAWGTYVESLRRVLMKQGGSLQLYGKASGLTKDTLGYVRDDVGYGPRPTRFDIYPLADCGAYQVFWECELITVPCISFSPNAPFADFTAVREISIDERGYTQISHSISLEVVNLITNPPAAGTEFAVPIKINRSADDYRDYIKVDLPDGFKRTTQRYTLSADQQTLDVQIVDSEVQSRWPFPQGIIDIKAVQDVRTSSLIGGVQWKVRLDIHIELMPDTDKLTGYALAINIIRIRRLAFKKGFSKLVSIPSGDGTETIHMEPAVMISREFNIRDDIYGNGLDVSISWDLVCLREYILKATKMFEDPTPGLGYNWDNWSEKQLADTTPYGRANMKWKTNLTASDLCLGVRPGAIGPFTYDYPNPAHSSPGSVAQDEGLEAGTYIKQHTEIRNSEATGTTWTAPLKGTGKYDYQSSNSPAFQSGDTNKSYPVSSGQVTTPAHIQHRRDHQFTGVYCGWTTRYGKPIPSPTIAQVDGKPVTQIGEARFRQKIAYFDTNGVPIYRADWAIPFVYNEPPYDAVIQPTIPVLV